MSIGRHSHWYSPERDVPEQKIADYPDPSRMRTPIDRIAPDRVELLKGALRKKGYPLTDKNIEELDALDRARKVGKWRFQSKAEPLIFITRPVCRTENRKIRSA